MNNPEKSIREAAQTSGINYSTAKRIYYSFKKTEEIKRLAAEKTAVAALTGKQLACDNFASPNCLRSQESLADKGTCLNSISFEFNGICHDEVQKSGCSALVASSNEGSTAHSSGKTVEFVKVPVPVFVYVDLENTRKDSLLDDDEKEVLQNFFDFKKYSQF